MTKKQVIKRAEQLNNMLMKLQDKIGDLLIEMGIEYYDCDADLVELYNTLSDLKSFDLEDSIINAKECQR